MGTGEVDKDVVEVALYVAAVWGRIGVVGAEAVIVVGTEKVALHCNEAEVDMIGVARTSV